MRENRTYGSEGGEPSNGSLPYPYQLDVDFPAGKGNYELCFGFEGGYYCEGIKLRVK